MIRRMQSTQFIYRALTQTHYNNIYLQRKFISALVHRHAVIRMTTEFYVMAMDIQKKPLKKLLEFHSADIQKSPILMRWYQEFQIFTKIFAKAIDKSIDLQYNTANKSKEA